MVYNLQQSLELEMNHVIFPLNNSTKEHQLLNFYFNGNRRKEFKKGLIKRGLAKYQPYLLQEN